MTNEVIADLRVKITSEGFLKLDKGAKKVNKSLNEIDKSQKKTKKSGNDFHKQQKSLYQSNLAGSKSFSKMAQTIGTDGGGGSSTLVSAYATLAANVFAATAAFGALSRAAEFTKLREGLEIVGNQSGRTLSVLADNLRDATGGALSLEQASSAAALGISGGFGAKELQGLAEIAKGAALTLGRSLPDAFDRLTRGAIKLEPEILDELGIMVRLDDAVEQYAAQLGKSANALTQMERRQAFMNAILEQGSAKFGEIAKNAEPTAYQRLGATFGDLTKDIFNFFNQTVGLEYVLGQLAESTTTLFGVMLLFGSTIVGTMIPALTGFASRAANVAIEASEAASELSKFAQAQIVAARAGVKDFKLGTSNFQVLQKSIANGAASTEQYNVALTKLRNSEKIRQKNLQTRALKNKTLKEQELAQIRQQIVLVEQLQAAENKADAFSVAARSAEINAKFLSKNAEVLQQVSAGEIGLGAALTANSVILGERAKELSETTGKTGILTKANTKLTNVFKGLFSQLKIIGAAFLRFLPILAGLTIAAGIAFIAFDKIFNTDEVKAYKKEMKKLEEILDALVAKGKEYQNAITGALPSNVAQIRQFQILSNSISEVNAQLKESIKARKELGEEDIVSPSFLQRLNAGNAVESLGAGASAAIEDDLFSNFGIVEDLAKTSGEKLKTILAGSFALKDTAEAKALKELLTTEIPGYGKFIKKNLDFDKLVEGNLTAFRDSIAKTINDGELLFGAIGDAVTEFKNTVTDAEKTASVFTQKFLPKTQASDLISNLNLISSQVGTIRKEADKITDIDKTVISSEEIGKSFLNVGSSLSDILGGDFINAQTEAKDLENEINKLKKAGLKNAGDNVVLAKLENDLKDSLNKLQKEGIASSSAALKTLKELNDLELTRKETQAQINKLKSVEKTILGKSEESGIIANTVLQKTLGLREEEAKLTNELLANKLNITKEEIKSSGLLGSLKNKQKELEKSTGNEKEIQAIKLRVLEEQGIVLQRGLNSAQKTFNIANAQLAVEKTSLKIAERKEALTQKQNAFTNTAEGQALGRTGASGFSTLTEQIRIEGEKVTLAQEKAKIEKRSAEIQKELLKAQITAYAAANFIDSTVASNIIADLETNFTTLSDLIDDEVTNITDNTVDVLQNKFTEIFGKDFTSSLSNSLNLSVMSNQGTMDTFNEQMLASASRVSEFGQIMADTFGENGAAVAALANFGSVIAEIGPRISQQFSEINEAQSAEDGITGAQANALKFSAVADTIGSVVGALSQSISAYSQQKIALIDQAIEKEKALDGTSEKSVNKIKALEMKKEAVQRKAFETNKKMQIAQAVISTASAMAQTYAALAGSFPLNIVAAAAIGALGLAQIAMIKKTQFTGGASDTPAAPNTALNLGKRSNRVDISREAGAGEASYLRGGQGIGSNANNFTGMSMGKRGYANGGEGIVVGERGPEVIAPSEPVDIIPNFALGGQGQNITFNINAVDGQSVQNMLMDQQGTIVGVIRDAANSYGEDFLPDVNIGYDMGGS